ncbi:MAG TPA: cation diffusion facilitator family transporter [Candidatus Corynebacterium gallistercoris]|uniref:Cation diffusion facilitator family transporter n=1 Tax=Candidatus Corynebacterium gallistercoris TaxID=2838530 RepID=A0A9D1UR51_9CORY|nr:cation diffusion facilitator family transporter [Candidatus Corynebacterium gallistercoris]
MLKARRIIVEKPCPRYHQAVISSDSSATHSDPTKDPNAVLFKFIYLSIAAALATIVLKFIAAHVTGSMGFLSDALESTVNLVAAIVALIALKVAAKPADDNHHFGHSKAEYFSALIEGLMIFIAAGVILFTAIRRLLDPVELEQLGIGFAFTIVATVINLAVGVLLVRNGRKHRSTTLVADGKHLLTDVWTTVGVIVGMIGVIITGWLWLDPAIAIVVGINILFTGYKLITESMSGLLSAAFSEGDAATLDTTLTTFADHHGVRFAKPQTVESGRQRFVYATMYVPAEWTVGASHDIADQLEIDVDKTLPGTQTFIHIEPEELAGTPHSSAQF